MDKHIRKDISYIPEEIWVEILSYCSFKFILSTFCFIHKDMNLLLIKYKRFIWEKKCKDLLRGIAKRGINKKYYDKKFDYFKDYLKEMYFRNNKNWKNTFRQIFFWTRKSKKHYHLLDENKLEDMKGKYSVGDIIESSFRLGEYVRYDYYCYDNKKNLIEIQGISYRGNSEHENLIYNFHFKMSKFIVNLDEKYEKFFKEFNKDEESAPVFVNHILFKINYRGDDTHVINKIGRELPGYWKVSYYPNEKLRKQIYKISFENQKSIIIKSGNEMNYENIMKQYNQTLDPTSKPVAKNIENILIDILKQEKDIKRREDYEKEDFPVSNNVYLQLKKLQTEKNQSIGINNKSMFLMHKLVINVCDIIIEKCIDNILKNENRYIIEIKDIEKVITKELHQSKEAVEQVKKDEEPGEIFIQGRSDIFVLNIIFQKLLKIGFPDYSFGDDCSIYLSTFFKSISYSIFKESLNFLGENMKLRIFTKLLETVCSPNSENNVSLFLKSINYELKNESPINQCVD